MTLTQAGARSRPLPILLLALSCATALGPATGAAAGGALKVSAAADRSIQRELDGTSVAEDAYIFVEAQGVSAVRFSIDGQVVGLDDAPPFDLAGTGAAGAARPLDTSTLSQGPHTALAEITTATGGAAAAIATFIVDNDPRSASGQVRTYADTPWASLHRDARNSDYTPFVAPVDVRPIWQALEGSALLTAVVQGPEGNLYVSSAREAGYSNLHAFSPQGDLLWASPPVEGPDDLESQAGGSSPVVDRGGNVYLSDGNQLFSFTSDGALRWDAPTEGAFITAVLTSQGYIAGITGDGEVHLHDPVDGHRLAPILELPGGDGPPPPPTPAGLWAGMMDPARINGNWAGLLGTDSEVSNTPALDPFNDLLFTVGAGITPDVGVVYGITLDPQGLSIAWQTEIGPGSGTSPTLSPGFDTVYVGDGDGVMYALDTADGSVRWALSLGDSLGSPSVGADGTLYTLADGGLAAVAPEGELRWIASYDDVAEAVLPTLPGEDGPVPPTARVDTTITVTPDHLYFGVILGYAIQLEGTGDRFLLVEEERMLVVDPADGSVVRKATRLSDTPESVITPAADGKLYISYLAVYSSVTYNSLNEQLPGFLQVDPPVGGIEAFEPVSYRALASAQVDWALRNAAGAEDALAASDLEGAWLDAGVAQAQIALTPQAVATARSRHQLGPLAARRATAAAEGAHQALADARNRLAHARLSADPDPALISAIGQLLAEASADLSAAGSAL